MHQNCQETSSSNEYTPGNEFSSDSYKSDFTQIYNQRKHDHKSSDEPLVFNAQIVFFENPSSISCLERSISLEPNCSQRKEKKEGK